MNDLAIIRNVNPLKVFTADGIEPLLKAITEEVDSFEPDLETANGRKDIASMANKVARSKTYLDGKGKELASEWKAKSKVVDNSRKIMREYLDELKSQVRAPLTKWENQEKERIKNVHQRLSHIDDLGFPSAELNVAQLKNNLMVVSEYIIDDSWLEFKSEAVGKKADSISHLETLIEQSTQFENDQSELIRLRKLEAEQKEKDLIAKQQAESIARETERIKKIEKEKADAVEKATREAEERLKADAQKIEQDKLNAIHQKELAEAKVKQMETEAKLAKEKAERERLDAIEQSKKNAELAALHERAKIETEKRIKLENAKKRESLLEHRRMIHSESIEKLMSVCTLSREQSQLVIIGIASKAVPNITISY